MFTAALLTLILLFFKRPERTDFVRMAALFNATIVPFAAIGKEIGLLANLIY
jgi:hypothetical protein